MFWRRCNVLVMKWRVICMVISLDTNIWIFGIREANPYCLLVLGNLNRFDVVVPFSGTSRT